MAINGKNLGSSGQSGRKQKKTMAVFCESLVFVGLFLLKHVYFLTLCQVFGKHFPHSMDKNCFQEGISCIIDAEEPTMEQVKSYLSNSKDEFWRPVPQEKVLSHGKWTGSLDKVKGCTKLEEAYIEEGYYGWMACEE